MEKILITTQPHKEHDLIASINNTIEGLNEVNKFTKANFGVPLNLDIAKDVINNNGSGTIGEYNEEQKGKLEKVGVSGVLRAELVGSIQAHLQEDLNGLRAKLFKQGMNSFDPMSALKYIKFKSDGTAYFAKENEKAITELFSIYVEKPEHIELHNAHLAAVEAMNKLSATINKVAPSIRFINAASFYGTFLLMDDKERFTAKQINYNII